MVFFTSKSKEDLVSQLEKVKKMNRKNCDNILYPIRIIEPNKIKVSDGRIQTNWELDFNMEHQMIVKRCISIIDIITVVVLSIVDIIMAFLVFFGQASIAGILFLLFICACEAVFFHLIYIAIPKRKIKCFVQKYLT